MHKGFKCLDVKAGRVYISRDVIFDEDVFPFANLHPNAGARLRSEILLLPSYLLNSSSEFGVDNSLDRFGNDSLQPNRFHEHAGPVENPASNGAEIRSSRRDFLSPGPFPFLAGTNMESGADLPAAPSGAAGRSPSDLAPPGPSSPGLSSLSMPPGGTGASSGPIASLVPAHGGTASTPSRSSTPVPTTLPQPGSGVAAT